VKAGLADRPATPHAQSRVAAKICGLTRPEDARHAERSGARYLGVIMASGPRVLDARAAAEVLGSRRAGVARVAVFGSQSSDEIIEIADILDLDVLQLHGAQSADEVKYIKAESGRAVWPVLRVDGTQIGTAGAELAAVAGALLLDAHVVGQLGGTGVTLDWAALADSVRRLRRDVPAMQLVLAGGLRVNNVGDAIRLLEPDVVDVSSGVEVSPGVKDPVAIERFVNAVQHATGNAG
jgi:phosphoribosylanthranilate isomerase